MKTTNFEYAQKKRKQFKIPTINTAEYEYSILILPIIPFLIIGDKIHKWNYNRQQWSDEKATKVLDYTLPHILEYGEDEDCYWYHTSWRCSNQFKKYAPVGLKVWTKKFCYKLNDFLENKYEKNGYVKTIKKEDWEYEHWIKFVKKENKYAY